MKKTAVLVYPNFSEYELTTALSILMQGAKPVSIIAINDGPIKGEAGLTIIADLTIDQVNEAEYDSLLLPGCMDIIDVLNHSIYIDFIKRIAMQHDDFIIASISSSPALLAKAGLLTNKNYTVGLLEKARKELVFFEEANYVNEPVVKDGNLITARGSAFIPFGIAFGKLLKLNFQEGWYGKL